MLGTSNKNMCFRCYGLYGEVSAKVLRIADQAPAHPRGIEGELKNLVSISHHQDVNGVAFFPLAANGFYYEVQLIPLKSFRLDGAVLIKNRLD